ncbi:MAG TPA: ATP-binding protein [Actinocrinis sp.]|nr:ATP-binding protein [Actinocrinis sp.]
MPARPRLFRKLATPPRRWAALPRRTVRLRLTALYGALVLGSGALMLGLTYALAANWLHLSGFPLRRPSPIPSGAFGGPPEGLSPPNALRPGRYEPPWVRLIEDQLASQRTADLHQLLLELGIALAALVLLSVAAGWWAAGRVLRPLRTMTDAARRISEDTLGARLAYAGPQDELKDLADTLDGLFVRLDAAFEAQRRFVANASHELRTPLARARTVLEVALDDPDATVESLKAVGRRVLASGEQQERLIDALLVLARSQRGLDRRAPFDLAALAAEAAAQLPADGPRLERDLRPAPTCGDPGLARRLVANVLDNAVRHNVPDGWIRVRTVLREDRALLVVENSGPVLDPGEVPALFEPFRRSGGARVGRADGIGVGLSIVAAVAAAHGATLKAAPLPAGGLRLKVGFPAAVPVPVPGIASAPAAPQSLPPSIQPTD